VKLMKRVPYVLLSAMFISGGIDAVLRPKGKAGKAETITEPVIDAAGLDLGTEELVRINGGVQVVAGLMLAGGVLPRLAATILAGSLIPTTLAGHRFWAEEDPQVRATQRIHFLKNAAMLGGLLLAAESSNGAGHRRRLGRLHAD
jgi:putative oxidoreductase